MLKETKKFHQRTKLSNMQKDPEGPVPISYIHVFHKEYPRFKKVDLPTIDYSDSEFETALDYRESTRSFSDDPLKLEHLSKVLQTCRIVDPNRNGAKPISIRLKGSVVCISTLPSLTWLPSIFGQRRIFPAGTNNKLAIK